MKRNMKVIMVLLISVGFLIVAGCAESDEPLEDISAYVGRYESEENPENYLEINANNTFEMVIDGNFTGGSTMITKSTLMLSAGSFSESMKIDDGVITTADGTKFIRNGN